MTVRDESEAVNVRAEKNVNERERGIRNMDTKHIQNVEEEAKGGRSEVKATGRSNEQCDITPNAHPSAVNHCSMFAHCKTFAFVESPMNVSRLCADQNVTSETVSKIATPI